MTNNITIASTKIEEIAKAFGDDFLAKCNDETFKTISKTVWVKKIVQYGGEQRFRRGINIIVAKCVALLNRKDKEFNEILADELANMIISDYPLFTPLEVQDAIMTHLINAKADYFVLSIQEFKEALDSYEEKKEEAWIATQESFD